MNNFFDKIFVINLDERTDRWEHAQAEFKKFNITNYERFPAIRLTELPDPNLTSKFMTQSDRYIKGAFGCRLSHIGIIQIAKDRGYKNVLILEDDFSINAERYKYFETAIQELNDFKINWDMFYLGITPVYQNLNLIGTHLYKVRGNCTGGHAYAVNSHFYDTILEKHKTSNYEIDNIYSKDTQINNNVYGMKPMCISQYSDHSDIRGHSVDYSKTKK